MPVVISQRRIPIRITIYYSSHVYENSDSAITFGAGWTTTNDTRASGGSYRTRSQAGSTACLTFGGADRVGVGRVVGTNQGKLRVTVGLGRKCPDFHAWRCVHHSSRQVERMAIRANTIRSERSSQQRAMHRIAANLDLRRINAFQSTQVDLAMCCCGFAPTVLGKSPVNRLVAMRRARARRPASRPTPRIHSTRRARIFALRNKSVSHQSPA
jgi:hypothetical protein